MDELFLAEVPWSVIPALQKWLNRKRKLQEASFLSVCDVNVPASLYMYRFKVDQQERDTKRTSDIFISSFVFPLPRSMCFPVCHSTSSLKKGDRVGINKKKRICSPPPLIPLFTPSFSHSPARSLVLFSLSHSIPTSISLILKSPSPKNKILLTLLHLLISTI